MSNFIERFPNLQAILQGTVSGKVTEWPAIRGELETLIQLYEAELDAAHWDNWTSE